MIKIIKFFILMAILVVVSGCQTLKNGEQRPEFNFFPPNASSYMAFNPKKVAVNDLPLDLPQEQQKVLKMLFKRSNRAFIFWQDLGFSAYFQGNYPVGIINKSLTKQKGFVSQEQGFREISSGLELYLPNKKELFISQNSLSSVLNRQNPPLKMLLGNEMATAFLQHDFVWFLSNPSVLLQQVVPELTELGLTDIIGRNLVSVLIEANKVDREFEVVLKLKTTNSLMARALSATLRTWVLVRPLEGLENLEFDRLEETILVKARVESLSSIQTLLKGNE